MMDSMVLRALVAADRRASYLRLSGGFPVPLAGMIYWLILAGAGQLLDFKGWLMVAVWGSGLIFPLALLLAKLFNCHFIGDRTAVTNVLLPAFISMLLFWPVLAASLSISPELAPLILAIGMSGHWPIIGWTYDRVGLYAGHALIRALITTLIWFWLPDARLTLLPLSVAILYGLTVLAILMDVRRLRD
ncbi:hypothetical protein CHU95_07630 [Niveispirillum lacus]|uniref:Uncharacterized protein n=2 Tax=Niveispirillum lacus TaxID=1981099 RepID=A0A255Z3W9_9PROT|nr:hypothetical protein CHU95_07630 [Niveispirillum lacus]